MSDPYKILGVPPTATDDEVKSATGHWQKNIIPIIMPAALLQISRMRR